MFICAPFMQSSLRLFARSMPWPSSHISFTILLSSKVTLSKRGQLRANIPGSNSILLTQRMRKFGSIYGRFITMLMSRILSILVEINSNFVNLFISLMKSTFEFIFRHVILGRVKYHPYLFCNLEFLTQDSVVIFGLYT